MTGFATDGHAYIGKAVAAGAAAVLCERPPEDGAVPYVLVENSRRALAVMAANCYGHPADSMTMVAVTGTNGKTTTTYLLKAILEQEAGAKVGLIGTNQNHDRRRGDAHGAHHAGVLGAPGAVSPRCATPAAPMW